MKIDRMITAITCKKMIRAKIDPNRIRLLALSEKVPHTAYGVDDDIGAMIGELLAETMDIDFNGIGCDLGGQSENLVFDQLFRHHAVLATHKEFEDRRFASGQDLRLFVDERLPAFGVEHDVADMQRTSEQLAGPAQQSFQSSQQLFEI